MEMQTGPVSPEAPSVSADEDALVSQVLEIIGGIAAEALSTLGEPEQGQEEGDDSVFFSDEDQDRRDIKTEAACSFSEEQQPGDDVGETKSVDRNLEVQRQEEQQHLVPGDEEQLQVLRMPEAEAVDRSEAADQEAQRHRSPESSVQVEAELKTSAEPGERSSFLLLHW